MTLTALRAALDAAYIHWEANSAPHDKTGQGAAWEGGSAMAQKTGATDFPTYYFIRAQKKVGEAFEYHRFTASELDGDWTLSVSALP